MAKESNLQKVAGHGSRYLNFAIGVFVLVLVAVATLASPAVAQHYQRGYDMQRRHHHPPPPQYFAPQQPQYYVAPRYNNDVFVQGQALNALGQILEGLLGGGGGGWQQPQYYQPPPPPRGRWVTRCSPPVIDRWGNYLGRECRKFWESW
jgi:hypothetical protein